MESCLLCLELQNEFINSIKVNSTQWHELQIENVIYKHLWPMQTIQLSSLLCSTCWKQLHDFHKFYIRIEEAHMNLDSLMKIEIATNETILMEQTVEHEFITGERTIIKQEYDQDIWNDDTPLIEIKKNEGQGIANGKETKVKDPLNSAKKPKLSNTSKLKTKKKESNKKAEYEKAVPSLNKVLSKKQSESKSNSDSDFNYDFKIERHKNIDQFISENIQLTCDLCHLPMESFQTLSKHFTNAHVQKGYAICCNKKFVKRADLFDHLQQHLNPNYLKCKQCDKVCMSRKHYRDHSRQHSQKRERIHCCDVCGLRFFTRPVLNAHKTTHLSEEEKQFTCIECGKKYGSLYTLSNHKRNMHGASASCELCGLVCVNRNAVETHKTIKHTVNKNEQYTCPICSKISLNQRSHKKHVKYSHQTDYDHKCTMCDKAFKTARALRHHVATHTGTPLYFCAWCPKTYKTSSNIASHRKKWHPKEWEEDLRKKYSGNLPPGYKKNTVKNIEEH